LVTILNGSADFLNFRGAEHLPACHKVSLPFRTVSFDSFIDGLCKLLASCGAIPRNCHTNGLGTFDGHGEHRTKLLSGLQRCHDALGINALTAR
jgi:hypothetical protein